MVVNRHLEKRFLILTIYKKFLRHWNAKETKKKEKRKERRQEPTSF